jgi:hypothetical protein
MEEGPPEYFPNGSVHGSDGRGGPAYERATTLLPFRRCTSLDLSCELSVFSFADFPAKRAESPFFGRRVFLPTSLLVRLTEASYLAVSPSGALPSGPLTARGGGPHIADPTVMWVIVLVIIVENTPE